MEEEDVFEPHVDIHALFVHYSTTYFNDSLGAASVEWSSRRMTSCGGVCEYTRGGGCRIKLSEPLLKFRPNRDIKAVLLHEMIHAYLMLHGIRDDDPGGHGTQFKHLMRAINSSKVADLARPAGGYAITIRHSMIEEVRHYQQHHWRCARCAHVVRRSMNRPPQEADCWTRRGAACSDTRCSWHMHLRHCGGVYAKTQEPEGYGKKRARPRSRVGEGSAHSGRQDAAQIPTSSAVQRHGVQQHAPAQPTILDFFEDDGLGPRTLAACADAGPSQAASGAGARERRNPSLTSTSHARDVRDDIRRRAAAAALRRWGVDPAHQLAQRAEEDSSVIDLT